MNDQDKIKAFEMRIKGCTLQEIGDAFGVTREYIRQVLQHAASEGGRRKGRHRFPNIDRWLYDHKKTQRDLAESTGVSYQSICSYLTGKRDPQFNFINKVLEITGMPYESAFKNKDGGL